MTRYHCRGCQDPDCPSCCEAELYEEVPEPVGDIETPEPDCERAADEALIGYERQIEARASQ